METLKTDQINKAQNLVKIVKGYLHAKDIEVPFYIAGGSVFSSITNTSYEDIDVYFYNAENLASIVDMIAKEEADYRIEVKETKIVAASPYHITDNAISLNYDSDSIINNKMVHKIQIIKKSTGIPANAFARFDLNCSMIAIDSTNKMHFHESWSREIKINPGRYAEDTFRRYGKYVNSKGALDFDDLELKKLIDHFVENPDKELVDYYATGRKEKCIKLLMNEIEKDFQPQFQYVHDSIVKTHDEDTQMEIFGLFDGNTEMNLTDISDTFVVAYKDKRNDKLTSQYRLFFDREIEALYPRASLRFPEYFI